MPDLTTTYLGLQLKNPLVASASPLSKKMDSVRRIEDAGAAALVMYSLFEEQITHDSQELDHYLERGTHSFAEAMSYFPDLDYHNLGTEPYLEHLHKIKQAVNIPVIGSLNGISSGGWVEYAHRIEQAGADALELNIYYLPTDPDLTGAELEEDYVQLVRDVRAKVKLPIAVKLSPYFSALPNLAKRIVAAGADALVLFNRFYQADFALTSGVHTAQDVLKAMMAGANVAMMTSTLLENGVGRIMHILIDLQEWMEEHEYESIEQMRGSMSQQAVTEPAAFERANYIKALNTFDQYVR